MSGHRRSPSYDQVVEALLAVAPGLATDKFDAELAAAEAQGRVSGPTARTLRWWQRQSTDELREHIRATLPQVLVVLAESLAEAQDAVDASEAAWDAAQPAPQDDEDDEGGAPTGTDPFPPPPRGGGSTGPTHPAPPVQGGADVIPFGPPSDAGRGPVDSAPTQPGADGRRPEPDRTPDHDRPGPGFTSHLSPVPAPRPAEPLVRPGGAAPGTDAVPGAPAPRLLGSGLSVLGEPLRPEDR
ncbi:MAG: hypothetical protein LCI03_12185 [Actinobacteria bacterium]|nr:hypothetical protein [Actinomycetota bacterium]